MAEDNNKIEKRELFPSIKDFSPDDSDTVLGSGSFDDLDVVESVPEIEELWKKMETKNDLLGLLNVAVCKIYGKKAKPITMRQLNYHTYSANNKKRYVSFLIPKKKKGEFRNIDAPCKGLKTIQKCLNLVFQSVYMPCEAAKGFVPNRSVVDGAMVHLRQRYVYNVDLKDFFPSITSGRVFKRLQSKPFCLNQEMASTVADLCCYTNADGNNVLPQGAPTSPTITNFICERLDRKLLRLAKAYKLKYTRYADDITFSGMEDVFDETGRFCQSLKHIIEEEEHFKMNAAKTRLLNRGNRQEVTGVTINEKPNVPRKYIKQLRTLIHNWETFGYEKAQEVFLKHYHPTKHIEGQHHIENIIAGKLDYLKMVKGIDDSTYRGLSERFEKLVGKSCSGETIRVVCDNQSNISNDDALLKELMGLNNLLK